MVKCFGSLIVSIVLTVILCIDISGQTPQSVSGFPFIQNYEHEDYSGFVQSWGFTQDDNGIIYVANRLSTLQYKGLHWDKISIPKNRVNSVAFLNGKVFIGGTDEFGYLQNSTTEESVLLEYYSLRDLISDTLSLGDFWEIFESKDNIFFRSNNFLIKYDQQKKEASYWNPELRFSYLFDYQGVPHVRSALVGVLRFEQDQLIKTEWGNFFSERPLSSVFRILGKEIFCSFELCYTKEGNKFEKFELEPLSYLLEHGIDETISLKDNTILFATRGGGIVQVDSEGNLIRIINESTGLINDTVYGLFEDRDGAVWVATIDGISRISFHLPFKRFDQRQGITRYINSMIEHNGIFYSTNTSGIYIYDRLQNRFNHINIESGCRGFFPVSNNLYTVCNGLLYLIEGQNALLVKTGNITTSVVGVIEEPNKVFLANSLSQSVGFLEKDSLKIEYSFNSITNSFNSISIDKSRNVWLGSDANGLFRINLIYNDKKIVDHKVSQFLNELNNPDDSKRVLVTEVDSEPAFLTWGAGIQRYDVKKEEFYLETSFGDFFSDTTRQYFRVEEDDLNNVWFRSGSAFQVALKKENEFYELNEGILNLISDGQNNDIYADEDSGIWFSIDRGFTYLPANSELERNEGFYTQIDKVLVRNDSLINGGSNIQKDILKYEDNELRFTYAAASYDAPEKTEYRVKLSGFEDDWSRWTSETFKDYTNIPEGDYSFYVQAKNVYGTISEGSPFYFSVLPPWYRTWWAYILYLMLVTAMFYSIYKVRINQLLKVERMRTKIASDLHDEVSATLTGISYFAEAVRRDKNKAKKEHFISLITESAGDAKEKITDIVWSINPDNDDWGMFLSKCRRYASDLLESKNIKYELKIVDKISGKLPMEVRQHLWMIYKEMLTNAVRHSNASRLDIIMDMDGRYLKLIVQDDGQGFDSNNQKAGNGVSNIKRRAEAINATLEIDSEGGFGTRWRLVLPL